MSMKNHWDGVLNTKPMNWDTYRFTSTGRPRKEFRETVRVSFALPPETVKRINNLAERDGISSSDALIKLLNTPQSEEIEPTPQAQPKPHTNEPARKYSIIDTIRGKHKRANLKF